MVPYVTSSSSGWMTFRGARRRRAIDRGFVLSDHVDWKDLIQTIEDTEAKNIVCTHGYKDIFSKYSFFAVLFSILIEKFFEFF